MHMMFILHSNLLHYTYYIINMCIYILYLLVAFEHLAFVCVILPMEQFLDIMLQNIVFSSRFLYFCFNFLTAISQL